MSDTTLTGDVVHPPQAIELYGKAWCEGVVAAREAAARADERAKVFAEYCAVLCEECGRGQGVHVGEDDIYYHGEGLGCTRCGATPIRRYEAQRAAA